jgi:hypothetical protein
MPLRRWPPDRDAINDGRARFEAVAGCGKVITPANAPVDIQHDSATMQELKVKRPYSGDRR